jgi:hypothetical protein
VRVDACIPTRRPTRMDLWQRDRGLGNWVSRNGGQSEVCVESKEYILHASIWPWQ